VDIDGADQPLPELRLLSSERNTRSAASNLELRLLRSWLRPGEFSPRDARFTRSRGLGCFVRAYRVTGRLAMNLEITKDERILILRCLFAETPLHDPEIKALANRLMELRDGNGHTLPLSMESNGAKWPDVPGTGARQVEQLPGGVSGRPQSGYEPQRPGQTHMSTGKYDRSAVEQIRITPTVINRKDAQHGSYLDVAWTGPGRGLLRASVWDEELFPFVLKRLKQESVFYVVRKGKYLNVVGVTE
jgi:hypothetical protein